MVGKLALALAWFVARRPRLVLGLAFASALLCLAGAASRISFSSDRGRLLVSNHPSQRTFARYQRQFDTSRELVVLVHSEDLALRKSAVEALARELRRDGGYEDILTAVEAPLLSRQGLFFLDNSRLRELLQNLREQPPIESWTEPIRVDDQLFDTLKRALESGGRAKYVSPWGDAPPALSSRLELQVGPEATVLLARVVQGGEGIDKLIRSVGTRHPGVHFNLGGDYLLSRRDGQRALWAAAQACGVALLLVHAFFRLAWGRPGPPRQAIVTVLVGIAWSLGWAALCSPDLNLITVNFAAALVGLGMDFNVYLLYRIEESGPERLAETLAKTGRENLVGALATACAFGALMLTGFRSIAELGAISAGGVLLCWLASVTVLPALVCLGGTQNAPAHLRWAWLESCERSWRARPRLVLALAAAVTIVLGLGARQVKFDGNLMRILPRQSATGIAESAFHSQCGYCPVYAASLAPDLETARARAEAFARLPGVARVESLALWVPASDAEKRALIRDIVNHTARSRALPPLPGPASASELLQWRERWGDRLKDLPQLGPGPVQAGLESFYRDVREDLSQRLGWLQSQTAQPPDVAQIPAVWRSRYVGSEGDYLIKIYAREDLWEPARCKRFLAQLRQVDPELTGQPVVTEAYLDELQNSYRTAARNALLAIVVLLWLSLRSLRLALLALLPKLLATLWMLGLMGWLGLPFNPVNAVSLPVTLGIGLVFGVHVLHGCLGDRGRPIFAGATGAAVAVSGISTMLGYLALLSVSHQGMVSLGQTMALGLAANLVAALVVFPVALEALRR